MQHHVLADMLAFDYSILYFNRVGTHYPTLLSFVDQEWDVAVGGGIYTKTEKMAYNRLKNSLVCSILRCVTFQGVLKWRRFRKSMIRQYFTAWKIPLHSTCSAESGKIETRLCLHLNWSFYSLKFRAIDPRFSFLCLKVMVRWTRERARGRRNLCHRTLGETGFQSSLDIKAQCCL